MEHNRMSAKKIILWLLVGVLVVLPLSIKSARAEKGSLQDVHSAMQPLLKVRLEAHQPGVGLVVGSRTLHNPAKVRLFYGRRNYRPAWIGADDDPPAVGLLTALADLRREALLPEEYHIDSLRHLSNDVQAIGLLRQQRRLTAMVDLELLATDAFLTSAGHMLSGRIDPETMGPEQQAVHKEADLVGALETAVSSGRVQSVLSSFLPGHDGYRDLRSALLRYRQIEREGGWEPMVAGAVLQPGRKDLRVPVLRSRLAAEGYLDARQLPGADRFDMPLKRAVMAFQRQHGLRADGAVGPQTLAALNVPSGVRARQIELNMERWRWLPRYLGRRYLLVNIAGFSLEVIDESQTVMTMRVVVGKDYRRTPVFSAELNKLVLNPHWYVPRTIFSEDLLPAIQNNPEYLQQRGYRVFSSLGTDAEEFELDRIDWQTVDPEKFPYILRQDPGPFNPMGRVKFLFPNKYDVYLHDSPNRSIFNRPKRTFSSGCIRIEKPLELTEYLLKDTPGWSRKRIDAEIEGGSAKLINAFAPLPIYIQYWTVWVDSSGKIQFREDIYSRDAVLGEVLSKR